MLRVKIRENQVICFPYIADNHGFTSPIRTSLRRCLVSLRDDPSDDPEIPATTGLDEKIVLSSTVSADLAERNIQGRGTDTRGFGEDRQQVGFVECEPAKLRQSRLLPAKFLYGLLGFGVLHITLLSVCRQGGSARLSLPPDTKLPGTTTSSCRRIPMVTMTCDTIRGKASA
jgi:hypothetical protein